MIHHTSKVPKVHIWYEGTVRKYESTSVLPYFRTKIRKYFRRYSTVRVQYLYLRTFVLYTTSVTVGQYSMIFIIEDICTCTSGSTSGSTFVLSYGYLLLLYCTCTCTCTRTRRPYVVDLSIFVFPYFRKYVVYNVVGLWQRYCSCRASCTVGLGPTTVLKVFDFWKSIEVPSKIEYLHKDMCTVQYVYAYA